MRASYKKLWKLLVDKDMSKGDLHNVDFAATSPTARGKKSTFMGNEVHSRGHEVHREQRGFCPSAP